MNVFDIVIAALLVFAFVRGLMKGFFIEVASLIALVGGVWGAIHFSHFAGDLLEERVDWEENYIALTAFAITFVAIVIGVSLLGRMLTKMADLAALGLINKLFGGVFALLKSVVILSVIFVFFSKINTTVPFLGEETLEKSILYQPVKDIVPTIFPSIIEEFESKEIDVMKPIR